MRLIKSVQRLEAGAAARAREREAPVALCWSVRETVVEAEDLRPGEYIACDLRVLEVEPMQVEVAERVTCDAADLGVVRDLAGVVVGRVTAMDGSLLTIEWDELGE